MRTNRLLLGAVAALLFLITACQKDDAALNANTTSISPFTITADHAVIVTEEIESENGSKAQVQIFQMESATASSGKNHLKTGPSTLLILNAPELQAPIIKVLSGDLPLDTKIADLQIKTRENVTNQKIGLSLSQLCGLTAGEAYYECIRTTPGYPGVIIEFNCNSLGNLYTSCMAGNPAY